MSEEVAPKNVREIRKGLPFNKTRPERAPRVIFAGNARCLHLKLIFRDASGKRESVIFTQNFGASVPMVKGRGGREGKGAEPSSYIQNNTRYARTTTPRISQRVHAKNNCYENKQY